MPANRRNPWLICYDIANPARLQRVHRTMSRHAIPVQYSVFYTNATRNAVEGILAEIEARIDPRHDDVRAYPLLTSAMPLVYGRRILPDGVALLGGAGSLFDIEVSFAAERPWMEGPGRSAPTAGRIGAPTPAAR